MVDGLEQEFKGRALIIRVDFQTDEGRELARNYGIDNVPSFIVFNPSGDVIFLRDGTTTVPTRALRQALRAKP